MSTLSRRSLLAGTAVAGMVVVSACTASPGDPEEPDTPAQPPAAVPRPLAESHTLSGDAATLAASTSALLLDSSPVAVLCPDDPALLETAAAIATRGHWPVLIGDAAAIPESTTGELSRLGVEHVIRVTPAGSTTPPTAELPDIEMHLVATADEADPDPAIPDGVPVGAPPDAVSATFLVGPDTAATAALATMTALGALTHTDVEDPREDATVMGALREAPQTPIVAVAPDEVTSEHLLTTATMAQRAPELPGGGVTVFPHRRLVALYGHPNVPVLGLLGEQGIEASIERVNSYVEKYQPLVDETVVPSWEIIASVATGSAGDDGNYSQVWPAEKFRPWVDAAKEAGVYVVLDLQPGRSDFLTQAQAYEDLLIEPHVGLALDPEWRLGPNERHLVRIGHVDAEEINRVSEWLAELVREHTLPQKILTLHQFRLSMIRDRDRVRTDHPELAIVLHADGQGGQGDKQATWRTLKDNLPEGMWLGWKNFYDEDSPMLTPEQTMAQVEPQPWFISYQ